MEYTKRAILYAYKEYYGQNYIPPQSVDLVGYLHESVLALVNILHYKGFYLLDASFLWDEGRPNSREVELVLKQLDGQKKQVEDFYKQNELESQGENLFTPVQLLRLRRLSKFAHRSCPYGMSLGLWTQLLSCVYYIRLVYCALDVERGEYLYRCKRGDIDHELFVHIWNTTEEIGMDSDVNNIRYNK